MVCVKRTKWALACGASVRPATLGLVQGARLTLALMGCPSGNELTSSTPRNDVGAAVRVERVVAPIPRDRQALRDGEALAVGDAQQALRAPG